MWNPLLGVIEIVPIMPIASTNVDVSCISNEYCIFVSQSFRNLLFLILLQRIVGYASRFERFSWNHHVAGYYFHHQFHRRKQCRKCSSFPNVRCCTKVQGIQTCREVYCVKQVLQLFPIYLSYCLITYGGIVL